MNKEKSVYSDHFHKNTLLKCREKDKRQGSSVSPCPLQAGKEVQPELRMVLAVGSHSLN